MAVSSVNVQTAPVRDLSLAGVVLWIGVVALGVLRAECCWMRTRYMKTTEMMTDPIPSGQYLT